MKKKIFLGLLAISLTAAYFIYQKQTQTILTTYATLNDPSLDANDYRQIVTMHSACFEPNNRKYLFLYLSKRQNTIRNPSSEAMLRRRVENYVQENRIEKLKYMRERNGATILRRGKEVIGMYTCKVDNEVTNGDVLISDVCVSEKHRRRGHGRVLMQHAIINCKQPGKKIMLDVYKDSHGTIKLYKSLNFKIIPFVKEPEDDFTLFKKVLMVHSP